MRLSEINPLHLIAQFPTSHCTIPYISLHNSLHIGWQSRKNMSKNDTSKKKCHYFLLHFFVKSVAKVVANSTAKNSHNKAVFLKYTKINPKICYIFWNKNVTTKNPIVKPFFQGQHTFLLHFLQFFWTIAYINLNNTLRKIYIYLYKSNFTYIDLYRFV